MWHGRPTKPRCRRRAASWPAGVHVLLPGSPETPTGGFLYDRKMLHALRRADRLDGVLVVPGSWPEPAAATIALAQRLVAALPNGSALLVDGLAFSPLLEVFQAEAARLALYALVHHPLADETGLREQTRIRLFDRERRALALVRGVVAASATTARRLSNDFGVAADRIRVVQPGIDVNGGRRAGAAGRRRLPAVPVLLCVAILTPRKGQDVLLRALASLRRQPWRLQLVGQSRNRAYARHLRRQALALRLAERIDFAGAVPSAAMPAQYRAADAFVLPSFHEGFGIVLAEAAAFHLPIIASDVGAIPEAVAGSRHCLVPPGDPRALARVIRRHLCRQRIGGGLRPAVKPRSWDDAGREFVAALDALGAW